MNTLSAPITLIGWSSRSAGSEVPVTDEISESADSLWQDIGDALPRIGVAIAIVAIGWVVSRLIRWALDRAWRRRRTMSFARVMSKLGGWVFLFLVFMAAVAITFPSVRPVDLLTGFGFVSVAVGFAFQDILENSFSGVLLLFRQPFTSGDQIQVSGQHGIVEGITIRETRIRAFDGDLIVIPNRDVYKNVIVVDTETPTHAQTFTVGVAYDTDLDLARRAICATIGTVEGVVPDPPPLALVDELNVSTVDIRVGFWNRADHLETMRVRDAAISAVKRRLDELGIDMPASIVAVEATPSLADALRPAGAERVDARHPG